MARISAITIRQDPDHHLLTIRRTIDFMAEFAEFVESAFTRTRTLMEQQGTFPMNGPIVRFHNTDLSALDVEAGWHITQPIQIAEDITCIPIPSGKVAAVIDQGPYEDQDPTMADLLAWVENNQLTPRGPIQYCYLNDTDRPEAEFLTEMCLPIT